MFKNKKIRNWLIAIVAVIVVVFAAVRMISPAGANASTGNVEEKVVLLEVAKTIEAAGSLETQPFAALKWKADGVVEDVHVKQGDMVNVGDILASLEPSSTSASIVSAQADLVNAQKDLDDLLYSNTDLAQTVIDLRDATEEYNDAVDYLDYLKSDQKVPQSETRAVLLQKRRGWEYKYNTREFKGPAPEDWIIEAENDLALKKALYDELQRTYDRLKDGPNALDVLAAQARVDAAQATVNSLYIVAPFDGQVLTVENQAGDTVDTGELSVNLADMDHLFVDAQVDETDIANVQVGQQAEVTLDALSGVTFTGQVAAINPVGEVVSGLVKYEVRIDLDTVSDQTIIPLGTTANVVIHVTDAVVSLAVPITAIQNDANGEFVLVVQSDGSTKHVDVVSGVIVGDMVVVSGNLKVGDRVQSNQASSFEAPNPFSGGE